ncbi:unnamed protein product [Allacma fusca]|uniref:DNA cross-link repair 1A protein n=1 Tax=Allacma fusca TaxID=39272 RepID=A0A8J2PUR6_9HEXA|nr:unnamed protein product [Allacma fusca]
MDKKKILFKKKAEPVFTAPAVVDLDSDSDFADFNMKEILTSDSATNTDTDTDSGNNGSGSSSQQREKDKEAWSGIMSKMRQPKLTDEKRQEAQVAWKGLMSTMQKNQNLKGPSTSKSVRRVVKTSKKPLSNPNTKRVKTEVKKSDEIITLDDLDEAGDFGAEDRSIGKSALPVHPLFLNPQGGSKAKGGYDDNGKEDVKPWELLHMDNPWECAGEEEPEIVLLNDSAGPDADTGNAKTKTCPFYKKMPGTKFSVDAFNFGVIPGIDVYLLSHFHSDHYIGLTKKFSKTLICSAPTGNLVKMKLGVAENCIRKLQLNKVYVIQGTEVVLVDANHCPGSVMFILRLPNGTTYLHTGDFRFTPEMLTNKYLQQLRVDSLYLDTTYCDPQYNFPTQTDSISVAIVEIKKHLAYRPRTLIVCGTYCIGKERVFCAVADSIGSKVFCEYEKRRVIKALENQYFIQLLCDKEENCQVHVLSMQKLNVKFLSEYLASRSQSYSNIFAVKPSGWEFSKGPKSGQVGSNLRSFSNNTVTILGVPYSEHSSFSELERFVATVNPVKVQPTVNVGNAAKRTAMTSYIDKWLSYK